MPRRSVLLLIALATAAFGESKFQPHVVGTGLTGGYQVVIVDMNHDGKPDLLAVALGLKEIVWYENPGWQRHVIATGINQPINATVVKLDSSGIPVLALAHEFSANAQRSLGIVSVLESQGDPTQLWKRTDIDRVPATHRLRTANGLLINAPLTNEKAVAGRDYKGGTSIFFYKPGDWKRELVTDADDGVVHCIYPFDWDGDGRTDILTASFSGVFLIRSTKDGKWVRTKLTGGSPDPWPKGGASDVAVGKLGKKRFLATIEPWHGNEVAVYNDHKGAWQREVIDTTLVDGHTLLTADLDADPQRRDPRRISRKGGSVNLYRFDGKQWVEELPGRRRDERLWLRDRGSERGWTSGRDLHRRPDPEVVREPGQAIKLVPGSGPRAIGEVRSLDGFQPLLEIDL